MIAEPVRTRRAHGRSRPPASRGTRTSLCSGRSRPSASRGTRTSLCSGFTLLEVLVAVLLLGLALTALVRLAGLEASATAQLREGTFAQWVAANALAETRLAEPFPPPGRREGEATLAGRRWRWQLQVQPTEEPSIHRLEVQVSDAAPDARRDARGEPAVLATLTGFAVRR